MESSEIRIDKEGIWYYRGEHMFRKEILCIFFEHLRMDENGKYLIELAQECCYLDVEDTVFVITAVYSRKDGHNADDHLYIKLTDDSLEKLDLKSLYVGENNILYCRIKNGKFPARFSRKSYYQLAEFIEQEEQADLFYISFNNKKYFINNNS